VVEKREGEKLMTTKKSSRPITIIDLLTHTSGMPDGPAADKLRKTLGEHVAMLSQDPLEFEPGTKVLYSDAGFDTLGRIIEVASGQPYEKFIEERILRPVGMKDSFFFPPPEKYNRIASAYKPQNGKLTRVEGSLNPDWQSQGRNAYRTAVQYPGPSWGLFSTASDMAAFYQMMLNGGTYNGVPILSRASVEAMIADYTGDLGPDGLASEELSEWLKIPSCA
jgi:CubicO group peptidase (beta-lactamase class C family)